MFGIFKKRRKKKKVAKQTSGNKKADMTATFREAQKKKKGKFGKKKVKKPCAKCEAKRQEIKLVELIEVVTRGDEGSVVNPGSEASKKFKKVYERKDKDGKAWKQYINLDKDTDGKVPTGPANPAKRRPDYGRYIEFRARVEWVRGDKSRSLKGKTVYFTSKLTKKGKDDRPKTMHKDEDHGFGSAGGKKEDVPVKVETDDGWTQVVKFYPSMYGGDQFRVTAQADEKNKGKPTGKKLHLGNYIVWRKFWYQTSRFTGQTQHDLSKSVEAYTQCCAEMLKAAKADVTWSKAELNKKQANTADHTVYPEYQCIAGSEAATPRTIVGRHNEKVIRQFLVAEPTEPVKAHLMLCDCQWDPGSYSNAISKVVPHNKTTAKTTASGAAVKPALKGNLLSSATWYGLDKSGNRNGQSGNMTDDFIEIPKKRSGRFNELVIKIPAEVAKKSSGGGIQVQFKIATAGVYLGDSDGYEITVAANRDTGLVNSTAAHEIGHMFWQAPYYTGNAASLPKSFNAEEKKKLKVYLDAGAHCSYKAKKWGTLYQYGVCTMATRSDKKNRMYCKLCRPYVRLQDMSESGMKKPRR